MHGHQRNVTSQYLHGSPYCPTNYESCLTLEKFNKNTGQYCELYTSLTLHLLLGNHRISSQLNIENILELKVNSMDEGVNINCSHLAHFSMINVHKVHLAHLTFHHCGVHNLNRVDFRTSHCTCSQRQRKQWIRPFPNSRIFTHTGGLAIITLYGYLHDTVL